MSKNGLSGYYKEVKKAVVYIRVSSEEQVDNYSLETQETICTKEAHRREIEIFHIFREEGRSAKSISGRPVLIQMLEFCRKNKKEIDAVIVYRIDRLARQTADYLAIRRKLSECNISIISTSEPTGNSPTDTFVETMLAGFAQMDNDVKSERSKNGLRARFLAGLQSGGAAPLGYCNQNGYITKDNKTWDIVKAAWELMATGTKTLREMAELLNEQGLREKHKGLEYKLRHQTLNRIFRNKFYAGKVVSKRYNQEVQGQQSPMITEEQYYRVQAVLDGRNTNVAIPLARKIRNNPDFPLRRIIKCNTCHASFTGAWSKGKNGKFAYYFCQKRCGNPSVPVKVIDGEMIQMLQNITPTPQCMELFIAFLRRTYYQRLSSLQKRREEADTKLKELYEFRQALIGKNLKGIYSDEMFQEQNKLLEQQIKDVHITKEDALIDKYNLEIIIEFMKEKFENLSQTYEQSSLEQKKVLLCSIFPSGVTWSYPGYSNTKISPYYQAILDVHKSSDAFSAG